MLLANKNLKVAEIRAMMQDQLLEHKQLLDVKLAVIPELKAFRKGEKKKGEIII